MTADVSTALVSGNTKPSTFRARAFQFTLNETCFYDDLKELLTNLKTCDYLISCKEIAPTTGHEHIHIYAHFSQTYKLSKKILDIGAHVEICKGSPKQNIDYIRKDGNILDEIGEIPHQGVKSVKELKETNIEECPAILYNIKEKIDKKERETKGFFQMLDEIRNDELKHPEVIYITGPPGIGKTYEAYKLAVTEYKNEEIGRIKINNEFFDVQNEDAKCFIIEEFRSSQLKAAELLQFIDAYGYKANVKGGFVYLRPKKIIICSVIHPEQLYTREENNKQFMRRITKLIDHYND